MQAVVHWEYVFPRYLVHAGTAEPLRVSPPEAVAYLLELEGHTVGLPEGYIYPKAERAVRDVWRKRAHLVRQHTANVLSLQNILVRNTGSRLSSPQSQALSVAERTQLLPEAAQALAVRSGLAVLHTLRQQIKTLEKTVTKHLKHTPAYQQWLTVDGIGSILAQTIPLDTGDMRRFPTVGQYASSCRGVQSTKVSNGKRTGQGKTKNGHKYLGWASREAAQFARRDNPRVQRFSQRKQAKAHVIVARKAVAHTLARACFSIMRDLVPFDADKAFGWGLYRARDEMKL